VEQQCSCWRPQLSSWNNARRMPEIVQNYLIEVVSVQLTLIVWLFCRTNFLQLVIEHLRLRLPKRGTAYQRTWRHHQFCYLRLKTHLYRRSERKLNILYIAWFFTSVTNSSMSTKQRIKNCGGQSLGSPLSASLLALSNARCKFSKSTRQNATFEINFNLVYNLYNYIYYHEL